VSVLLLALLVLLLAGGDVVVGLVVLVAQADGGGLVQEVGLQPAGPEDEVGRGLGQGQRLAAGSRTETSVASANEIVLYLLCSCYALFVNT